MEASTLQVIDTIGFEDPVSRLLKQDDDCHEFAGMARITIIKQIIFLVSSECHFPAFRNGQKDIFWQQKARRAPQQQKRAQLLVLIVFD